MNSLLERRWIAAIPATLGLGIVLLAVFAAPLGIDHNPSWGGRRVFALLLGISLAMASAVWFRPRSTAGRTAELKSRLEYLAAGYVMLFVLAAYVWFISLGRWTVWTPTTFHYDRLATAFTHGQLNIEVDLDPALLRLPNPYDIDAREGIQGLDQTWDMSLYNGKIYLYFGAAPALMLAGFTSVCPAPVGDAVLAFIFLAGLFFIQSSLILILWRRFHTDIKSWMILPALLVAGLAFPVPWMLVRPRIHEAAIAAGQFFLMGGFFFALIGLDRRLPSKALLAAAGIFWALAAGTRAILAIPIVFLSLMVFVRLRTVFRAAGSWRGFLSTGAALAVPLVVGAAVIAWHNWARFGSVIETGLRYQLTLLDLNASPGGIFALQHILPNLYVYFVSAPITQEAFPFIRPVRSEAVIAYFSALSPLIYNAERITGLAFSNPFLILAALPAVLGWARQSRIKRRRAGSVVVTGDENLLKWAAFSMAGAFAVLLVTHLLYFYATVRFVLELMPFAMLLAIAGFWQGHRALAKQPRARVLFIVLAVVLAIASIIASVLLAFSSDGEWIRQHNPAFVTQLIRFFRALARRF
jgi:hypothetical protein